MCCRYYVDSDTLDAIGQMFPIRENGLEEKLFHGLSAPQRHGRKPGTAKFGGDIHPTDLAPVMAQRDGKLAVMGQRFGFPLPGGGLVFNARSESVLEKPLFRDGVLRHRAVIPAAYFYEWSRNREKYTFCRADGEPLLLAGFCECLDDGQHFVILTTDANISVQPVHDRMPLVLEQRQAEAWIFDDGRLEEYLRQEPAVLQKAAEYEQMTLFQFLGT